MQTVTISPKFQIVIPKEIRESLRLSPGQKVQTIIYDGRIELIPLQSAEADARVSEGHRYNGHPREGLPE